MGDSIEDMQQFVLDEIEYMLKGLSDTTVGTPEVIEHTDEIKTLLIAIIIGDSEMDHKSSILIDINKEDQDYYIVFGEDNLKPLNELNLWQALFFNKDDSDESKRVIKNLNAVISNSKGKTDSEKLKDGSPLISKGWR